jgi:hypothetical protein
MDDFDTAEIAYIPTTGVARVHDTPLVIASDESLKGYGCLVGNAQNFPIEIVPWPAQGWRKIDANSGDQGGVTEGLFEFWWKGETLYARNNAVGDSYLFGWSNWPERATSDGPARQRERALVWRANYHPDGALRRKLSGAAGAARRRRDARAVRLVLLRRQDRALHSSQCLARRGGAT